MTNLNQLVAVTKGLKEDTNKITAPLFHNEKQQDQLAGLTANYRPVEEDGDVLPSQTQKVRLTVPGILSDFSRALTRLFDVVNTIETAVACRV